MESKIKELINEEKQKIRNLLRCSEEDSKAAPNTCESLDVFCDKLEEKLQGQKGSDEEKLTIAKRKLYKFAVEELLQIAFPNDSESRQEVLENLRELDWEEFSNAKIEFRADGDEDEDVTGKDSVERLLEKKNFRDPSSLTLKEKAWNFLKLRITALEWIPNYNKAHLPGDIVAGLTVGIMLIPQSIAYALVADMPPAHGLYTCFVPLLVYAMLGSSRQLAVGPAAMIALLTKEAVVAVGYTRPGDTDAENLARKVTYTLLVSVISGFYQFIMGAFRLGFVTNFLSHSVLSGFTTAAALVIMSSQFKYIFGISPDSTSYFWQTVREDIKALGGTNGWTVLVFSITTLILIGFKILPKVIKKPKWSTLAKFIPSALIVVILFTLVSKATNLKDVGVKIVGFVQGGLRAPSWPAASWGEMGPIALASITLALLGFLETISVAKYISIREGYEIDPSQELMAVGIANMFGGLFGAFPVAGGYARTAVNVGAGAKSPLASVISSMVIMLSLIVFQESQLLYDLPKTVLASIVVVAIVTLFDFGELIHCWRLRKKDAFLWALTFILTLVLGIETGIVTAVGVSIILVIQRASTPHYAVLGRLPGTTAYRNVKRFPESLIIPGVSVLRFDASLLYFNTEYMKNKIRKILKRSKKEIHYIILDFSSINDVDTSGVGAIIEINGEIQKMYGTQIIIASPKGPVRDLFERANMKEHLGPNSIFAELHEAVVEARLRMQSVIEKKSQVDLQDLLNNPNVFEKV